MGSACSGNCAHKKIKIKKADGSGSRQKEHDLSVFVHGSIWSGSGGGTFHCGYAVLGRRILDWKMVPGAKRSLDETGSRSSDVEAGKRTCRSSDV